MTRPRRAAGEQGVNSLEWLGLALVAGSVVVALTFSVSAEKASASMARALCGITGGQCAAAGQAGGAGAASGASGSAAPCASTAVAAAGPVRGVVPVEGASGLRVSVLGDGSYQVTRSSGAPLGASSGGAAHQWVQANFDQASASGLPGFLTGAGASVYSASSAAALADVVAADRRQTWQDSVFGDTPSGLGALVADVGDATLGVLAGGPGLPEASATFSDRSPGTGLSLNAYDQVKALDAAGVALGTLTSADGSTTDYYGISAANTGPSTSPSTGGVGETVPLVLQLDRDPSGVLRAVRIVSDHDLAAGTFAPTSFLQVAQVPVTASTSSVISDLAASLDASAVAGFDPPAQGSARPSFTSATAAFTTAATAVGSVQRVQPQGVVTVSDPNAPALQAGLKQVLRSPAPQSWDGTGWVTRVARAGCGQ